MPTAGPNFAGAASGSTSTGTNWTNTSNATGSTTGTFALWANTSRSAVGTLALSSFGLSVPAGSTITQISVSVVHLETSTSIISSVTGQCTVSGTAVGTTHSFTKSTTSRTDTFTVLPAEHTFAVSDIPNIGVNVVATRSNSTSSGSEEVDTVSVTVTYTLPLPVTFRASSATSATSGFTGVTSQALVLGSGIQTGDMVIVAVSAAGSGSASAETLGLTGAGVSQWLPLLPAGFGGGSGFGTTVTLQAFYGFATASTASGTVTATRLVSGQMDVAAAAYPGALAVDVVAAVNATASGGVTTLAEPSGTAQVTDEMLVDILAIWTSSTATITPTNPTDAATLRTSVGSPDFQYLGISDSSTTANATGAVGGGSWSWTGAGDGCGLLLSLSPSPVYQITTAQLASGTSLTIPVSTSQGVGLVLSANTTAALTGVSDSQGNHWIISTNDTGQGCCLAYATYGPGGPGTPTNALVAGVDSISFSGSNTAGDYILSGVLGVAPYAADATPAYVNGNSGTATGNATGTLSQASDILITAVLGTWASQAAGISAWGNSETTVAQIATTGNGSVMGYLVPGSTASITPSATMASSEIWIIMSLALLTQAPSSTAGGATLTGSGSLTASGQLAGSAALAGAGTLSGAPWFVAAEALAGAGTLGGAYTPIGITATNGGDGISNGTTVTVGNSGGLSGSPWDTVTIGTGCTLTADNSDPAAHGPECYLVTSGATAAASWVAWTATTFSNSPTTLYVRVYVRLDALPPGNFRLFNWNQGTTLCAGLNVLTTGQVRLINSASGTVWTSTSAIPTGQWVRIEGWLTGDPSAGQAQIRIWSTSPDSSGTPDQDSGTQTGIASTGAANGFRFGLVNSVANITVRIDSLGGSTTTWLGPDTSWSAALSGQGTLGGSYAQLATLTGQGTLTYTPPFWMGTAQQISLMDAIDHAVTLAAFGAASSYAISTDATTPGSLPGGYATTPVLKYISYGQLWADITGTSQTVGSTTYTPISGGINAAYSWLLYDTEDWSPNPPTGFASPEDQAEIDDPWTYMADFVTLAHAHGYKVILTPGRDLGNDPTSVHPNTFGSLDAWYENTGIATAMATAGADICHVQTQADSTNLTAYTGLWNDSYTKVQTAAPGSIVTAGLSTAYGTPAQMAAAAWSVPARGYWLNSTTATVSDAVAFLEIMAGQSPPVPALSGTGTLGGTPVSGFTGSAGLSGSGTLGGSPILTAVAGLSGTGTLGGAPARPATAALSGSGTLGAAPVRAAAPALAGSGTLAGSPVFVAAAALSGSGTLTGSPAGSNSPTPALAGSGSLSAAPVIRISPALSGQGTLSATAARLWTAALSGSGTLSAAPVLSVQANLSGAGTLGTVTGYSVSPALSGLGTLSGGPALAPVPGLSGLGSLFLCLGLSAALSGTGTLSGSYNGSTTAALAGSGTLTAAPALPAAAALTGAGTLGATGALPGVAALTGTGALAGAPVFWASASLAGLGTLSAAPVRPSAGVLTGSGQLGGSISWLAIVTLSGSGTLGSAYQVAYVAAAMLAGLGTLDASPTEQGAGDTGTITWTAWAAPPRWRAGPAAPGWSAQAAPTRWHITLALARWHTAPAPPRWRIIMASFDPIAAISPQFVNVSWTSQLDGTTVDPTVAPLTVEMAFPVSSGILSAPAQPVTWFAASWLSGGVGKGYIAQCLVGPAPGLVQLAAGTSYDVWSRILGTPEQPTIFAGVQPVY